MFLSASKNNINNKIIKTISLGTLDIDKTFFSIKGCSKKTYKSNFVSAKSWIASIVFDYTYKRYPSLKLGVNYN